MNVWFVAAIVLSLAGLVLFALSLRVCPTRPPPPEPEPEPSLFEPHVEDP